MRSKTSYFNPTLFKKNLSRFWPLWGGASLLGALAPLYLLSYILLNDHLGRYISDPLEITLGYYEVLSVLVPAVSLVYGALCALASWGWLYNPRSVGLYHSLPITRKGLFVTNFLSGMAMMLIPYAVTGGLAVLVTAAVGGVEPVGLLVTTLGVLGESFFYFAAATLIAFLTGNPFAFAAFHFIFHFLAAGAEWMVTQLMTTFYFGVDQDYQGALEFLSPTMFLTRKLDVYPVYQQITTQDGWIERGVLESVTLTNGWYIALYALAGLVLLACAWALYRRRRSESAGDVVAVGWMKPIFRYGVALCAAVTGGTLFYGIFFSDFQDTSTARPLPMALCMAVVGIVGYYIASMLLAKSLRVFRGSWRGVLITVLAAGALCFAVAADPLSMETRVPQAEELESVNLYLSGPNGRSIFVYLDDPAALEQVLEAHRAVVAEREALNRRNIPGEEEARSYWISLDLRYYGKEDAWKMNRGYNFPYTQEMLEQSPALRALSALACSPLVQEEDIFGNVTGENVVKSDLIGGTVLRIYDTETGEASESPYLTQEKAKVLEAAIRRDIQAGHFGKTLLMVWKDHNQAALSGDVSLYYNLVLRGRVVSMNSSTQADSRPQQSTAVRLSLSTYCTETLKALEDIGILDATHKLLTHAEWDAIEEGPRDDPYLYEKFPGTYYGEPFEASTIYPDPIFPYDEEIY